MRSALGILAFLALVPVTPCVAVQALYQEIKSAGSATDRKAQEREQDKDKDKDKEFPAQPGSFRKQAAAAFDREMERDKTGDCPDAHTTYDEINCLGKTIEITNSNYKAYIGALRSFLGLRTSREETASGPAGKPLTGEEGVKEFDEVEALWQKYRSAQTSAVYDHWKGGTIAPVMAASCELRLLRNHMRELDSI